jgi:hypothetical protein
VVKPTGGDGFRGVAGKEVLSASAAFWKRRKMLEMDKRKTKQAGE